MKKILTVIILMLSILPMIPRHGFAEDPVSVSAENGVSQGQSDLAGDPLAGGCPADTFLVKAGGECMLTRLWTPSVMGSPLWNGLDINTEYPNQALAISDLACIKATDIKTAAHVLLVKVSENCGGIFETLNVGAVHGTKGYTLINTWTEPNVGLNTTYAPVTE